MDFNSQTLILIVHVLLACDILPKILIPHAVPPHSPNMGILCSIFGHTIIGPISLDA